MIVLDSSAAVDIVRDTTEGKAMKSLFLKGELVVSSDLYIAEVANAFWKYVNARTLELSDAQPLMIQALSLVDRFVPLTECYTEALAEAARLKHPVYDVIYLVIARRNAATLATLDKKLLRLCAENGVNVIEQTDF